VRGPVELAVLLVDEVDVANHLWRDLLEGLALADCRAMLFHDFGVFGH
jgi:hypothetical protein